MKSVYSWIVYKPQPAIYWPHDLQNDDQPLSERRLENFYRWW
jgi:hypothetical protein